METVKVAVGKVLQIKNRLIGRLNRIETDIKNYNSTLEEQSGRINVRELFSVRSQIKESLLELKNALYKGNAKIQDRIFELAEKKADVDFCQSICTRDGKERHDYQNTEVTWKAVLTKTDIDNLVKNTETEIDRLQDEINNFNYSTKIDLSQRTLDLAS